MTDLVNPYDAILAKDPLVLTPPEAKEYEELTKRQYPSVTEVALGLTAAWVFYRKVIRRRLLEELDKEPNVTPTKLQSILSILYHAYVPSWLGTATPAAVAGYRIGAREAAVGAVPEEYLQDIAEGYVRQLGEHLNEVSTEALMEGFHAQINRKHPAVKAARQVADAYGVPPRAMNTLVSVWNSNDAKKLTNKPIENFKEKTAVRVIENALHTRDKQIGEVEAWNAKTSAKQIVWMYKQQEGIVPRDAKRTWITAKDEKVCPSCGPLNRKSAPIAEKFKPGVWTPPLHVNCRCDVILDFRPNDIDQALAELFEYEEVGKAYGKDMYDRDKNGRFSAVERRTARPAAPKIQSLWDQVNVKSIAEDIQEQLKTLETPTISAPISAKPIGSLTPISAGQISATPIQAKGAGIKPKPISTHKISRPAITPPPIERSQVLRTIVPRQQKALIETIQAVADYGKETADWVPFGWEESEYGIAFLIDPEEYGDTGTLWIGPDEQGVYIGNDNGEHGGHLAIAHKVSSYWDDKEEQILGRFVDGDALPSFTYEGRVFDVDHDTITEAIAESVYQVIPELSNTVSLVDGVGDPHDFTIHEISQRLGVTQMVEDARPFVVVTQYANKAEFKKNRNGTVSNPGKYQVDIQVDDILSLTSSNLPTRVRYVNPMDQ